MLICSCEIYYLFYYIQNYSNFFQKKWSNLNVVIVKKKCDFLRIYIQIKFLLSKNCSYIKEISLNCIFQWTTLWYWLCNFRDFSFHLYEADNVNIRPFHTICYTYCKYWMLFLYLPVLWHLIIIVIMPHSFLFQFLHISNYHCSNVL